MAAKNSASSNETSNDKALATPGPTGAGGGREGVLVDTNMNNTTAAGGSSLQTNQTGTSAGGSSGMAHTKTTTVTISPYMDFRPDTSTDDYYKDTREKALESYDQLRMSLDSSGGLASKVAKSNRNTHAVTSAAEPTSGGAGGGGYRGASENLRKMLKSHGVTVSSVDDMLSDQQPTQSESAMRAHAMFTSTPANLAELDQRLKDREEKGEVVTKEYLGRILDQMNGDIKRLQDENTALKSEKWLSQHARDVYDRNASAAPSSGTSETRGRSSVRQQPPPPQHQNAFRPMRSHSPANAAAMTERQRRSQSAEGMLSQQGMRAPLPRNRPPVAALNVSHMSDQEVIRQSMDRGLLDNVDNKTVQRLQMEINAVKAMYDAKMTRYEDHIEYLKQQMQLNQVSNNANMGTGAMRVAGKSRSDQDDGFVQDAGLCIKCAKHEAVISTTHGGIYMEKIDQLSKEVAALRDKNDHLKGHCSALQQRETDSYSQVKHSVQLVEQAQLERTQAMLECQQMKEELIRCERKLQDAHLDARQRANAERESVRAEVRREIDTLNNKIATLIDDEASVKVALEKAEREKNEMRKQLEKAKRDVEDSYFNVNKVSESVKSEIAAAIVERDDAKQELENTKRQFRQQSREAQQEMNLLRSEIDELRRRLSVCEKSEKDGKEQLFTLTEYVGKLEKEAFQSKRAREQSDTHFQGLLQKAKDREESMRQTMSQQKNKFDLVGKDMDDLMASQNVLIGKLKTECKHLLDQLQTLSFKYQSDVENLESANVELVSSLKKRQKQVKHFEREAVKHGRMHHRMKTQLNKMATASSHAQNEVAHLAVKHNNLLRERDVMAQELTFFKSETLGMVNPELQSHLATLKQHHYSPSHELLMEYPELFQTQNPVESKLIGKYAMLECQQMKEELIRCERKLQDAHLDARQRANAERESVRAEVRREIDTLNNKIATLIDDEASVKVALEKAEREKNEMRKQLEKAKRDVEDSYFNVNKVSESVKSEIAAAIVERDDAKQELENTKRQFRQQSREAQQEMNLLRSEIDELRRRLSVCEKSEKDGKEQLFTLTEYVGKLEKEAFQSKRAREQSDTHFQGLLQKAKDREESMRQTMSQQKNKFDLVGKDMDDLMASQNVLIGKLKTECKHLLDQLQTLSFKYQSDVENLESANVELVSSLKKRQKQVKHFEREAVKHGRMHHRMKTQLNKMATASSHAQNEVAHLAVKHNNLLRERDVMAQELTFFKSETLGMVNPELQSHLATLKQHHYSPSHELLMEYPELFQTQNPVESKLIGKYTEEMLAETERQIAENVFTTHNEEKSQT